MKKTKTIVLLSFFLLVFFSFSALAATIPVGAIACTDSQHVVITGNNPRQVIVDNWDAAVKKQVLGGKSWVGKLKSNGPNDHHNRVDTGRETIIFVPCTTDFNKKIEIMYFFHGLTGFSYFDAKSKSYNDMNLRVAPQAKQLSEAGRNFVIVFPEMPWSAGTSKRSNQNSIWEEGDSNLIQLHQDAINILKQNFNPVVDVGYVSMVGHSAGGAALRHGATRPSKSDNALKSIGVNKIVFSDSDYGWGFGSSTPFEKRPSALLVYEHYLQYNSDAEMYMLVQDPSRKNAHQPTQNAILTVKKLGGPQVASWSAENVKWSTSNKESSSTLGAVAGKVFKVPGHPNINYVPLNIAHKNIGKKSLAWLPTDYVSSQLASSNTIHPGGQTQTQPQTQTQTPTQTQAQTMGWIPNGLPKSQEEIDEVWSGGINGNGIGMLVRNSNKIYAPSSHSDPDPWKDFQETYYTWGLISSGMGSSSPPSTSGQQPSSPQPPAPSTGHCFPLTSDSFTKISDNWGNSRSSNTRCHVGIDIYNKPPGIVVALEAGKVVGINKDFTSCEDGWGTTKGNFKDASAVLVYNSQLDRTINYGEIDNDKVIVNVGDQVQPGQKIGVASYCGTTGNNAMLHLELYSGKQNTNIKWKPNDGYSTDCKIDALAEIPPEIQNPTNMIKNLQGKYCDLTPPVSASSPPSTSTGRVTPTTCKYNDNGLKTKSYSQISGEVFDPGGSECTLCREDQRKININCNGKSLSFEVCWKYETQIKTAVQNICNSGFPINDIVGFREGRTYSSKTKFGQHPYGVAIDINREFNGLYNNCKVWDPNKCTLGHGGSENKQRTQSLPGTITKESPAYQQLTSIGWKWGGDWGNLGPDDDRKQKDFMHFSLSGK
jgi:murein DD-endopeptidase MepM/ murein hydrolase activator NlpD